MVKLVRGTSVNTKSEVIASELKAMAEDEGQSSRGGIIELKSGSNTLPVKIGTERAKPKVPTFSHENLKRLGNQLNLSGNSLL